MRACAGGAVVRLALVVVAMCVRVLMCVCVWMCWHARGWIKQHVHAHVGREEDNVVCGKAARIRCVCVPHGGERKSERARGHRRALEGERGEARFVLVERQFFFPFLSFLRKKRGSGRESRQFIAGTVPKVCSLPTDNITGHLRPRDHV